MPVTEEQLNAFYRSLLPIAYSRDSPDERPASFSASSCASLVAIAEEDRYLRQKLDAAHLTSNGIPTLEHQALIRDIAKASVNYANEAQVDEQFRDLCKAVFDVAEAADATLRAVAPRRELCTVPKKMVPTGPTFLRPDQSIVEESVAPGQLAATRTTRAVIEDKAVLADTGLFFRIDELLKAAGYVNINKQDDASVKSLLEKITASARRERTSNLFLSCGRSWCFGQIVPFHENGQAGFDILLSPMETLVQPWESASDDDIYRSFMLVVLSCLYDDLIFEPEGKDTLLQRTRDELLESYRDRHIAWSKGRASPTSTSTSVDDVLSILDSANMPLHTAWVNMQLIPGTLSPFTDPDYTMRYPYAGQTSPLRSLSSFLGRVPSLKAESAPRFLDAALHTPPNSTPRAAEYMHHLLKQLPNQYVQATYPTPHSHQVVFTGSYGLGLVDETKARTDYVIKLARRHPAGITLRQGDLEYELGIMTGSLRDNASDAVPLVAAFEQTTNLGGREPYLALVYEYRGKAPPSWSDLPIEIRSKLYVSLLRLHQHFGVVHGDVAFRNVVVDEAGDARWIDFGQAVTGHECRGRQCPELRAALKAMELRAHRRELSEVAAEGDLTM